MSMNPLSTAGVGLLVVKATLSKLVCSHPPIHPAKYLQVLIVLGETAIVPKLAPFFLTR
jgi:hypothetical protein